MVSCGKVVEAFQVVEAIVVMRLKSLVVVMAFVVKRSGVSCGYFWEAM